MATFIMTSNPALSGGGHSLRKLSCPRGSPGTKAVEEDKLTLSM